MGKKWKKKRIILFLVIVLFSQNLSCSSQDKNKQEYNLNTDSNYIKEKLYVHKVATKMLNNYFEDFGGVFNDRIDRVIEIIVDTILIHNNKILAFPVVCGKDDDYYDQYSPLTFKNEKYHFFYRLCPLIGYRDSTNGLWKLFPFPAIVLSRVHSGVRSATKWVMDFLESEEYTNNGRTQIINGVESTIITKFKYKLSDPEFWDEKNIWWIKGFQDEGYYLFEVPGREPLKVFYPDSTFIEWYKNHKFK
jgi:hypothetical protein